MTDVLVVGAGPVGLTLAAELARHGASCRVVDRLPRPTDYCKAIGVTPRTLEVWEDMGVVRPMMDAGLWLTGFRLLVNGQVVKEVSAGLPDVPYGYTLGLPQYETERLLGEHLRRMGVVVERGTTVSMVEAAETEVSVALDHGNGEVERTAFRYVVGCDGAHSAIRRTAGIGFPGEAYPVEFMLGDVVVDWTMPRGIGMRAVQMDESGMTGFLVAVPLPEQGRYRLSTFAPPELTQSPDKQADDAHGIQAERTPPSLADLQAVADQLMPGTTLSDLRWSSIFRISMRLAEAYRHGRLFVAGDAAHIHPPTGGQGMNTGIQDAYNLAWKLALVVRGEAPESLLDSYEVERRPVGEDVLERTIAETQAFSEGRTGGKRGGDTRLEDSQLIVNYRRSVWVLDEGQSDASPAAGDRAPDAIGLLRQGMGTPLRLFDLLRGTEHVLLTIVSSAAEVAEAAALAQELRARFGRRICCYGIQISDGISSDLPSLPLLHDTAGSFRASYGDLPGTVFVVRPDGYVGYRGSRDGGPAGYLGKVLAS